MDQHRPLTERQQLYNCLQELRKLKAEGKKDLKFAKEYLPDQPCVRNFIRNLENMIRRVEKRE